MIEVGLAGAREPAVETLEAYRGWSVGFMELEGLGARSPTPGLEAEARRVEEALRESFGGRSRKELASIHPLDAYAEHFGRRGKAYPVLLQAEAIASKGRRLAMPDPLVLAMFAAELGSFLLCAAHDLDALRPPLELGEACGTLAMPTLGGAEKAPPRGDLVLRDREGIVASVLLGPDSRTSVVPETSRALFAIYAPPEVGEDELEAGLGSLEAAARLACPEARRSGRAVLRLGRGSRG